MKSDSTNLKEQVKIREKALANGNISLYLDIYQNKKRRYEFLKLYLVPEKTRADKDRNKQTIQMARSIQAKRIVELQNGTFGFLDAFKLETNFIDYYTAMMEKRKDSNGNYGNWKSALKHLWIYR